MIKSRLPKYHAPKQIIYVDKLPRTANGKIETHQILIAQFYQAFILKFARMLHLCISRQKMNIMYKFFRLLGVLFLMVLAANTNAQIIKKQLPRKNCGINVRRCH